MARTQRGRARNHVNGLGSGSPCKRLQHGTNSMVSAAAARPETSHGITPMVSAACANGPRTEASPWFRQQQRAGTKRPPRSRNHIYRPWPPTPLEAARAACTSGLAPAETWKRPRMYRARISIKAQPPGLERVVKKRRSPESLQVMNGETLASLAQVGLP